MGAWIVWLCLAQAVPASAERVRTSGSIATGYTSFRDQLNVGLVYRGADLSGRVGQHIAFEDDYLQWDVALGFGVSSGRGMLAIEGHIAPVAVAYLFQVVGERCKLWIGPGLSANYRWYLNPELQSGSFFWYTHYDLELRAAALIPVETQRFALELSMSALSAASRPDARPDPYFYDWGFVDLISAAHSNMRVGTVNQILNLELVAEWLIPNTTLGLAYVLVYDSYRPAPALDSMQHLVRFTWH